MAPIEREIVEFGMDTGPLIKSLVEIKIAPYWQMAENYSKTWSNSGINIAQHEAERKILNFNPNGIFILLEPKTGELLGQIYTVPIKAESLPDFIHQFPTYRKVEEAAKKEFVANPNFVICFSLNCKPGYYVRKGGEVSALPKFILQNLPVPESAYKIGFSFITMKGPSKASAHSMLSRYRELVKLEDTRSGGPAMMHEAFGGIIVAFLPGARPEHKLAGGGVTLVVYPRNPEEAGYFGKVKENRLTSELPGEAYGNHLILKDLDLKLPA